MDGRRKPGDHHGQFGQNLLFSLLVTALGLVTNVFHTVVDRMALSLGREATAAGLLISVYALGSLSSVVLSSALADRIGKRRVILAALAVMSLGFFVLSVKGSYGLLLAGLYLYGFGFGPSEGMASAVLTDQNPRQASLWMNVAQAGFGVGAIIGPMAAMAYVLSRGEHQGVFLLCGLLGVLFFTLVLLTAKGRLAMPKHAQRPPMNIFSVLKEKRFRYLALTIFLYLGYESVSPSYIKQLFLSISEPESMASLMISLFWGSMIVGRLTGTLLTGKELQSIRAYTAVAVAGLVILVLARTTPLLAAGVALLGLGCGPVWPMLVVLAARMFPERSGSAIGMMMVSCMLSFAIFPTLIGTLPGNLTVTFILCAILAALVYLVATRVRADGSNAQAVSPDA